MGRMDVEILDDDEEADEAAFMLDACGIIAPDFYLNERILTKENFEKNYNILEKMVETRHPNRAPYFVIGYFALLTGGKISNRLREKILEAAEWKYEIGYWEDEGYPLWFDKMFIGKILDDQVLTIQEMNSIFKAFEELHGSKAESKRFLKD